MTHRVAVRRVQQEDVDAAVREAIDAAGGFRPREGSLVVLKPNLCSWKSADSGITTDIRVVEAVVKYVNAAADCRIAIVETSSEADIGEVYERHGYHDLAKRHPNVRIVNLDEDAPLGSLRLDGHRLAGLAITQTLWEADHFINIPKLKTHGAQKVSANWKNNYGLVLPVKLRPGARPYLSQIMWDVNNVYQADLCVVDALRALEGPGPIDGTPRPLGLVLAGKNALSVDLACARVMGFGERDSPLLRYALRHDRTQARDFVVDGEAHLRDVRPFEFIPPLAYRLYRLSMLLGRWGMRFERVSNTIFAGQFAIRTAGSAALLTGGVFSLRSLWRQGWEMVRKMEL